MSIFKTHNFFKFSQNFVNVRSCAGSPYDHSGIKKIKLLKRLMSTLLFGSTFVAVIYAKKYKSSKSFQESKLVKVNPKYHKNFKLYEYKGFVLPIFVMKNLDKLQNFQCREDDVFVACFPKTGTTWLQEIIYCVLHNENLEEFSNKSIEDRFPYLEFIYPGLSSIEKMPHQRLIKTHLPYSLLPHDVQSRKPKIFYLMRNPKDVAVSYYHFVRMMTLASYTGTFEDFMQDMLADEVPYGPMWKHNLEMWEHRNDSNILILSYEDLQTDIHVNIKNIAEFLGKNLSDEEIDKIAVHCSFNSMSNNPSVNYQHWDDIGVRKTTEAKFMRKGIVGDWKNYFNDDLSKKMDFWVNEHFSNSDISFIYDLKQQQER